MPVYKDSVSRSVFRRAVIMFTATRHTVIKLSVATVQVTTKALGDISMIRVSAGLFFTAAIATFDLPPPLSHTGSVTL